MKRGFYQEDAGEIGFNQGFFRPLTVGCGPGPERKC